MRQRTGVSPEADQCLSRGSAYRAFVFLASPAATSYVEMPPVDYRRLGMIVLMYGAYSQVYRQVNGHARISTRKRSTVRSLPDRVTCVT